MRCKVKTQHSYLFEFWWCRYSIVHTEDALHSFTKWNCFYFQPTISFLGGSVWDSNWNESLDNLRDLLTAWTKQKSLGWSWQIKSWISHFFVKFSTPKRTQHISHSRKAQWIYCSDLFKNSKRIAKTRQFTHYILITFKFLPISNGRQLLQESRHSEYILLYAYRWPGVVNSQQLLKIQSGHNCPC